MKNLTNEQNENILMDSFHLFGNSLDDFRNACKIVTTHTKYERLDFSTCAIDHLIKLDPGGMLRFYRIPPNSNRWNQNTCGKEMRLFTNQHASIFDEVLKNGTISTGFRFYQPPIKQLYLFEVAKKTFFLRLPVPSSLSSFARDIYLSEALEKANEKNESSTVFLCTIRSDGPLCRLAGIFSGNPFRTNPEQIAIAIKKRERKLGKSTIINWDFTQKGCIVDVYFEKDVQNLKHSPELFPRYGEDAIPCYRLCWGDTGDYSQSVQPGVYFANKRVFPLKTKYIGADDRCYEDGLKHAREEIQSIFNSQLSISEFMNTSYISNPLQTLKTGKQYSRLIKDVLSEAKVYRSLGKGYSEEIYQKLREQFQEFRKKNRKTPSRQEIIKMALHALAEIEFQNESILEKSEHVATNLLYMDSPHILESA